MTAEREAICVLLVDDQRFVGTAIERLIATERDVKIHCCLRARDAVAQANQLNPAVILQDLVMPEIDGLTLVGMFRENRATAETPVIVLSGNDDAESRRRAIAAGASDYLVKLPHRDELLACIRRHAGSARGTPAPDRHAAETLSTAQADPDDPLDREVIASFRDAAPADKPAFAAELIGCFLEEAVSQSEALRDASRRQDDHGVRWAAHRLKGSSATIGAKRLAALCREVEGHVSRHPGSPLAPTLLAALDRELVRVREACIVERDSIERSLT